MVSPGSLGPAKIQSCPAPCVNRGWAIVWLSVGASTGAGPRYTGFTLVIKLCNVYYHPAVPVTALDPVPEFESRSPQPSLSTDVRTQAEWDELDELWDLDAITLRRSSNNFSTEQIEGTGAEAIAVDPIVAELAELQTEVAYKRAAYTLRDWLENLDLTPRERRGLEGEIAGVGAVLEKLERATVQIAAFGMVGRGKSSVLNALLGKETFTTGVLHGVTIM